MAQMDLFHNITPEIAIPLDSHEADITLANSLTIDTQGYESVTFVLSTEETAGTGDFFISVFESDTDVTADFTRVANSTVANPYLINLLGVVDVDDPLGWVVVFDGSTDNNKVIKFAYIGKKRYLRLPLTTADTPSLTFGVVAILGNPLQAPTPDSDIGV